MHLRDEREGGRGATLPRPRGLFANLSREHGFEPVVVEGRVPSALRGTLYRNGVGLMELFGERSGHLFEADGAISALRFGERGVEAAARVIASAGLEAERAAGRRLGVSKNTANTHVVPWQGGLYALMEGGLPTQLDPETIEAVGEATLGGVVRGMFSAHPHRVEARRSMYNFGMRYGAETAIVLYALPDVGPARCIGEVPLEHPVMLHDFVATERRLVFVVSPLRIDVGRLMEGAGFVDSLVWTPDAGAEVILVPIDAPDEVVRFRVDAHFQFHFASAFEDRGEVVVDYVHYDDARLLGALGDGQGLAFDDPSGHVGGRLHRARIDPVARTLRTAPLWDGWCEFPRISEHVSGARTSSVWVQSEVWRDGVLRFGVSRIAPDGSARHHWLEPGQHASEPVLAQAPGDGELGGSVLVLVYDSVADTSHALVLNAETLDVCARVRFDQAIPLRFHGSWVPAPR